MSVNKDKLRLAYEGSPALAQPSGQPVNVAPALNEAQVRPSLEDFSQKVKPGTKAWLNRFKVELSDRRAPQKVLIADILNEALAVYFRANAGVLDAEKRRELEEWLNT